MKKLIWGILCCLALAPFSSMAQIRVKDFATNLSKNTVIDNAEKYIKDTYYAEYKETFSSIQYRVDEDGFAMITVECPAKKYEEYVFWFVGIEGNDIVLQKAIIPYHFRKEKLWEMKLGQSQYSLSVMNRALESYHFLNLKKDNKLIISFQVYEKKEYGKICGMRY